MDRLDEMVKVKLELYGMPPLCNLMPNTQERLRQVEYFIESNNNEIKELIVKIKKLKLTKALFAHTQTTNFSRKTIYNDKYLRMYIEKSLETEEDYLNEKRVEKLCEDLNEIKSEYEKQINQVIESSIMEIKLNECNIEIKRLIEYNNKLREVIHEKELTIKDLKANLPRNKSR